MTEVLDIELDETLLELGWVFSLITHRTEV
jgi:hypothetical protein